MPEPSFIPYATTTFTGQTALVLAPHADDETLGCGGTILGHTDHGDRVEVVILTDGAAAKANTDQSYIQVRESEACAACESLGCSRPSFWRLPDRALSVDPTTINRLAEVIRRIRPGIVYVTSPAEIHPDHRAAARLAWQAIRQSRVDTTLAFYEVSRPFRVNALVNITDVIERKRAVCNLYHSQLEIYPYTDIAIALNRFRSLTVAASADYVEGFLTVPAATVRSMSLERWLPGLI